MEYTQEYLNNLIINKIEENLNLDYKAAPSLENNSKRINEISKDISAFANSDGGIIIYGIKEDVTNKHLPDQIDPVKRNEISKEWLEQVIQTNIRPRIQGVLITPVEIDGDTNNVVYIVEIPQSNTIHQANDKKYYKRFNFNSEPMYDYEIRDVMNRSKNPVIDLIFKIKNTPSYIKDTNENIPETKMDFFGRPNFKHKTSTLKNDYTLQVFAINNGIIYANYVNAFVTVNDLIKGSDGYLHVKVDEIYADNTIRDLVDIDFSQHHNPTPKYGPSRYDPILPKRKLRVKEINISEEVVNSDYKISWSVYADNSTMRSGEIKYSEIEKI